ncbi:MAG TPA: adenylate/guanylate cyclase domain-containing protein [Alphaproteobacteria bacterium]|nr:adenylate/guanylate cyclase domain-containing protein [Alphaproteobacteria bacterium]
MLDQPIVQTTRAGLAAVMRDTSLREWLIGDAWAQPTVEAFVAALAQRLLEAEFPLARLLVLVGTLHPEYFGAGYLWQEGIDRIEPRYGKRDVRHSPEYLNSPIRVIRETDTTLVRVRLEGTEGALPYPICEDLRAEGFTDYAMVALPLTDGRRTPLAISSRRAGGFTDGQIERLVALAPLVARIVELHAQRWLTTNLLETYTGHEAARRILAGEIERGRGETLKAAIWFSDLRDFTALSERLSRDELLAVLNAFFERQVDAVRAHGGEVLKFMGDGMLAIFPLPEQCMPERTCTAGLEAARTAVRSLNELNVEREAEGAEPLRFGLALHVGEVMYGNVGARDRLDFTVIGPAVNLVSRLQRLTGPLGETVLVSADYAQRCGSDLVEPRGQFALKGIADLQTVYAMRPSALDGAG